MAEPIVPKHDHATLEFPKGFLWGSATSAFQVEGNNIHSDWWEWEQKNQPPHKRSGEACDEYHLYEKDFDLAASLGHNAHRLSLEWSRIEPEEGIFDMHAIEHYQKVLKALKDRRMKVMLTIHHFSNPAWFAEKGGWESGKSVARFERFVRTVIPFLKDNVDLWITINEPGIYAYQAYTVGQWPPNKKSNWGTLKVTWNLARAHKKAYKIIHELDPDKPVGIAQNVQTYEASHKNSPLEMLTVMFSDEISNHGFYLLTKGFHDFLGINYYFHHRFNTGKNHLPEVMDVAPFSNHEVSDLGWEVYPVGMFDALTEMADGLPIYITECGIATSNDDRRIRFLMQYLQEVNRAIKAGVHVKGFFYWSLLDNLEWDKGFGPSFGLIEVDFKTQKRTIRPSALIYADIIKHNGIRHELMKFLGHRVNAEDVIEIPGVGPVKESQPH